MKAKESNINSNQWHQYEINGNENGESENKCLESVKISAK